MPSRSYTDSVVDTLVSWFGREHQSALVRVADEYRGSSPGGEWGCLEDFAWAVHIVKHHVSTDVEEHGWAVTLLGRANLTTADVPRTCPEADCGQC